MVNSLCIIETQNFDKKIQEIITNENNNKSYARYPDCKPV